MEGPSLYLAKKQLAPFKNHTVLGVSGNTKTKKDRLRGKKVKDIFSWGKHLVFQFDDFAVRIHFLLFGTFSAIVKGISVTGDYKKARVPRLALTFENGAIEMYNCSIKFFEEKELKGTYDFSIDIMSPKWDEKKAFQNVLDHSHDEIADILLDQTIFAGVGNIIKNEILSIQKINPKTIVQRISKRKLIALIQEAHAFSHQFLRWRKVFKLRANLKAHRKGTCPHCHGKMIREKTGKRARWSYWCPKCQPLL